MVPKVSPKWSQNRSQKKHPKRYPKRWFWGRGQRTGEAAGGEGDINFVDGGGANLQGLPKNTAPTVALRARWPDSSGLRPVRRPFLLEAEKGGYTRRETPKTSGRRHKTEKNKLRDTPWRSKRVRNETLERKTSSGMDLGAPSASETRLSEEKPAPGWTLALQTRPEEGTRRKKQAPGCTLTLQTRP